MYLSLSNEYTHLPVRTQLVSIMFLIILCTSVFSIAVQPAVGPVFSNSPVVNSTAIDHMTASHKLLTAWYNWMQIEEGYECSGLQPSTCWPVNSSHASAHSGI